LRRVHEEKLREAQDAARRAVQEAEAHQSERDQLRAGSLEQQWASVMDAAQAQWRQVTQIWMTDSGSAWRCRGSPMKLHAEPSSNPSISPTRMERDLATDISCSVTREADCQLLPARFGKHCGSLSAPSTRSQRCSLIAPRQQMLVSTRHQVMSTGLIGRDTSALTCIMPGRRA
jgi:hypothetical protein